MEYNKIEFLRYISNLDIKGVINYLQQIPEKQEEYKRYVSVFESEQYEDLTDNQELNDLLKVYHKYYRNVFYLKIDRNIATATMIQDFIELLHIDKAVLEIENPNFDDDFEDKYVRPIFEKNGYSFLGGDTSGFYGPYIWQDSYLKTFDVELPFSHEEYTIRINSGFISNSWLDFISQGVTGTGGWAGKDGIINCNAGKYDFEGGIFQVSLLKHEAQHILDNKTYQDMETADLEYRAKLIELIYSNDIEMLKGFARDARNDDETNGHQISQYKIKNEFEKELATRKIDALSDNDITEVNKIAEELYVKSNNEMDKKYERK